MQRTEELLSALLDGEIAPTDLDRLIEALDAAEWAGDAIGASARWAMMGGIMRGRRPQDGPVNLVGGVRAALVAEGPATAAAVVPIRAGGHAGGRNRRKRWFVPVTGLAAAASLALAAVLVPGLMRDNAADEPFTIPFAAPVAQQTAESPAAPLVRSVSTASAPTEPAPPRTAEVRREEQLNSFHIEYAGYRAVQGAGGPLGYARFAAHNADLSQSSGR